MAHKCVGYDISSCFRSVANCNWIMVKIAQNGSSRQSQLVTTAWRKLTHIMCADIFGVQWRNISPDLTSLWASCYYCVHSKGLARVRPIRGHNVQQSHHHDDDQAAWRPHILCPISSFTYLRIWRKLNDYSWHHLTVNQCVLKCALWTFSHIFNRLSENCKGQILLPVWGC